jgi:ABC-type lipoprotein export system ATPase subunit
MLQVQDLKKSFPLPTGGSVPILDIPSFRLEPGEQVALVGKSGGGKTTFLHIIAGITRADSGQVTVDNIDLTRLSEAGCDRVRAARIGYVFQTFNLLPAFSALENVLLGMTFAKSRYDRRRAIRLLEQVDLADRLHYKPRALSVGQQQRVAVARALANRPKLLLADEPTANVDAGTQQRIIDLLREVCDAEKVAMLLVTHAADIASQFPRLERLEQINRLLQTVPA